MYLVVATQSFTADFLRTLQIFARKRVVHNALASENTQAV